MIRILIIDDSAAMRDHVRETLQNAHELGESLDVGVTASGFEALRLLHRNAYDVVVLDIKLPDIDGLELIRFIRQSPNHRDVGLVIVSAFSSAQERARASALGAHAFVAKPFTLQSMCDAVIRSLAARHSRVLAAT